MKAHMLHSRREFIKRTLATTGTLGLATASGQFENRDKGRIDSNDIEKLVANRLGIFELLGEIRRRCQRARREQRMTVSDLTLMLSPPAAGRR
jgi:hypothetical protein